MTYSTQKAESVESDGLAMSGVTRRSSITGMSTGPLMASSPTGSKLAPAQTHVVVVGAGAFGGWTALHLLRMGARVTLLDGWGPGNARSSSGGETRVIRGIYGRDRIYVEWVRRALELWQRNQKQWKTTLYHRTGLLWMFVSDDEYARQSLPLAEEFGLRVDRLKLSDAQRRFPQISFDGVNSVYFEPEAGYLKARQACRLVCDQFRNEGGTFQQAMVRPGPFSGPVLKRLECVDGTDVSADSYVFACGPWLGNVLPRLIGSTVRPTRQEVYYFGTPAGDSSFQPEEFPVWLDYDERLYYGIPAVDQRGFKIADDTRGEPFDPTTGDRTPSPDGIDRARKFIARRFPRLRNAPLLEARVCQYENSPDGHLIVDRHPEVSNVWIAGGGSGHGFKLSPAVGEHLAKCILGETQTEPAFTIERLAKLRTTSIQYKPKN